MRLVSRLGCAIALIAAAVPARADPTLPGGGSIALGRLFTHTGASASLVANAPDSYFDLAHCACSQRGAAPASFVETTFAFELLLVPPAGVSAPADVWVGSGCDDPATRAANCHQIASSTIADLSMLPTQPPGATPEISVYDLMVPEPSVLACQFRELVSSEWVMADTNGGGAYNYVVQKPIATDALAPDLPSGFVATPDATSIEIAFTPAADTHDLAAYQAVCATVDGSPVSTAPPAPRYLTARNLCGESLDVPLVPSSIDTNLLGADAGNGGFEIPQGVAELDPAFLCGDQPDPTASSIRLAPLPTGKKLVVVLLAIDRAGNAAATYFLDELQAVPKQDLWQDLHQRGGRAEGGFCLVAETFGDDHPITHALRAFRADVLAPTPTGRAIARAYYALGTLARAWPPLAAALAIVIALVLGWPLVLVVLVWRYANRHAAWPRMRSPSTVPVGVGRQPRATRSSSSSFAVGR